MQKGELVVYVGLTQPALYGKRGCVVEVQGAWLWVQFEVHGSVAAVEAWCYSENLAPARDQRADTKASNPKDAIGSTKLPMDLVPDTLEVFAATAFTEGALKYGAYNWRVAGVRASIYYAAMKRHMKKWWNGENADAATKVHHLASVIACATIILDAEVAGMLTDDRPPAVELSPLIDSLEATVKHLKELHKDKSPMHHTNLNYKDSNANN